MFSFCYRACLSLLLLAVCFTPAPVMGQEADSAEADYAAERDFIESTLGTMVKVIKTATFRETDSNVSTRLEALASRLNAVNQSLPGTPMTARTGAGTDTMAMLSLNDLQELEDTLNELYGLVRDVRTSMEADDNFEVADQLAVVEESLDDAVVQTRRLIRNSRDEIDTPVIAREERIPDPSDDEWLSPGSYDDNDERIVYRDAITEMRHDISEASEAAEDAHRRTHKRTYYRYRKPSSPFEDFDYADAYVGEFYNRWPYRETGLYRPIPAIRYNRVEGLVLGARFLPLEWGDWEQAKVYGQAGYAFELKKPRFEVGTEIRPFRYLSDDYDFKFGASYRRNTSTNDLWKMNWVENTIAALLFEYDYLDYYQVDGVTLYAMQRLSPYAQFSLGYRSEEYSNLIINTNWSLFGATDFRVNPPVDETRINSLVFALEGGQLSGMYTIPRGAAFRFEAEVADGFNDVIGFTRYLGDMRFYIPFSYSSSLGLRFRAGYVDDDAPIQKLFTLGGVGSVRAYPQNVFIGSRMLLANIEYTIASIDPLDDIFDDIQLFGFGDAGWVNAPGNNELDLDDVFPAAGVGLSFADRSIRLELAWPLKEFQGERDPTLWLRLTPTF